MVNVAINSIMVRMINMDHEYLKYHQIVATIICLTTIWQNIYIFTENGGITQIQIGEFSISNRDHQFFNFKV